jgi:hypothetical protein
MPTYVIDIDIKETRSILINADNLAAAVEQSVELEEKIRNQDDTPPAFVTVTEDFSNESMLFKEHAFSKKPY